MDLGQALYASDEAESLGQAFVCYNRANILMLTWALVYWDNKYLLDIGVEGMILI